MTISAGEVRATLTADVQRFKKQLKAAQDELKKLGKSGKGAAAGLGAAGKGAAGAEKSTSLLNSTMGKLAVAAAAAAVAMKGLNAAYDSSKAAAYTSDASAVFKQMGFEITQFRKATKGLISDAELVKKANLAENMGITGREFMQLANIADAAAKKTGQSQAFMFDSIVTGTARSSKLILDNLGIMVDWGAAHEAYAKKAGKTVKQLSDFEKKQSEVNQVLAKGQLMIEEVGSGGADAGDAFDRFEASLANAGLALGELLLPLMSKLVGWLGRVLDALSQIDFQKVFGEGFFKGIYNVMSGDIVKDGLTEVERLNNKTQDRIASLWQKHGSAFKQIMAGNMGAVSQQARSAWFEIKTLNNELNKARNKGKEALTRRRGKKESEKSAKEALATKKQKEAAKAAKLQAKFMEESAKAADRLLVDAEQLSFDLRGMELKVVDPSGVLGSFAEAGRGYIKALDKLEAPLQGLSQRDFTRVKPKVEGSRTDLIKKLGFTIADLIDPKTFQGLEKSLNDAGTQLRDMGLTAKEAALVLAIAKNTLQRGDASLAPSVGAVIGAGSKPLKMTNARTIPTTKTPAPKSLGFLANAGKMAGDALGMLGEAVTGLMTGGLSQLLSFAMDLAMKTKGAMDFVQGFTNVVIKAIQPFSALFKALDPLLGVLDVFGGYLSDFLAELGQGIVDSGIVTVIMELMRSITMVTPGIVNLVSSIIDVTTYILDAFKIVDLIKLALLGLNWAIFANVIVMDSLYKAIVWVVQAIMSPIQFLTDWIKGLVTGNPIDVGAYWARIGSNLADDFGAVFTPDPALMRGMTDLINATEGDLAARGESTYQLDRETNARAKLNEGLFNLPTGFKVAAARFGAQTPEQVTQGTAGGGSSGGISIAGDVYIKADNVEEFKDMVERGNMLRTGSPFEIGSPFGGGA